MRPIYYHILEYSDYGNIGWQGCYLTFDDAEMQLISLRDFFPNSHFQIEESNSKREPNNVTA